MSMIDLLKSCITLNKTYVLKKLLLHERTNLLVCLFVCFFASKNSSIPQIHVNSIHIEIYLL